MVHPSVCSACGTRAEESNSEELKNSFDPVTWNLWQLYHRYDVHTRIDAARALIALKEKGLHTHEISISREVDQTVIDSGWHFADRSDVVDYWIYWIKIDDKTLEFRDAPPWNRRWWED